MSEKENENDVYDNAFDNAICEYCGCELRYAFNRIRRHSQPETLKHKQGNIPICNDCITSMRRSGDLVLDPHTHTWVFYEDNISNYKF